MRWWDPGRLYNLGNIAGLLGGVAGAVIGAQKAAHDLSPMTRVVEYFAGNAAAVFLSLATTIFIWAGTVYNKAWTTGKFVPDPELNQTADVLSGIGAIFFGVAMMALGDPLLAATGGAMHAVGKFGSAYLSTSVVSGLTSRLATRFKETVLLSRLPTTVAAIAGFLKADPNHPVDVFLNGNVIFCYLVWAIADFKLLPQDNLISKTTLRLTRLLR